MNALTAYWCLCKEKAEINVDLIEKTNKCSGMNKLDSSNAQFSLPILKVESFENCSNLADPKKILKLSKSLKDLDLQGIWVKVEHFVLFLCLLTCFSLLPFSDENKKLYS